MSLVAPAADRFCVAAFGWGVVVPPRDTPAGRLISVTDPSGAVFTLLSPS